MLLNKNNLSVVGVASREAGRYSINGVCVTPEGMTAATDGRRLMTCSPCTESEEEFPFSGEDGWEGAALKENVIIEGDHIIAARKALPKKKAVIPFLREHVQLKSNGNGRLQLLTTDLANTPRIETRPIEGEFPYFDEVIPNGNAEFTINVNPGLLSDILDIMDLSMDESSVKMEFYGPNKAMKLSCTTSEGQEMVGVLMPISIKGG